MGAVEQFARRGIRLELADGDNVRAIGTLNDSIWAAIKTQKIQIVDELQWQEFEALLSIVAPAYNTPAHEIDESEAQNTCSSVNKITEVTSESCSLCTGDRQD